MLWTGWFLKNNSIYKIMNFIEKIIIEIKFRTGIGKLRLKTVDRDILENIIIPYFISINVCQKILFVGVDWYTFQYESFFINKEFWTIDKDKAKKRYGSKRHIIDSLRNIDKYFEVNYFDLIILNGVFGWGLKEKKDVEKSFDQCYNFLRSGGYLIIGWNDIPEVKPFPMDQIYSLTKFNKYYFKPLSSNSYYTDSKLKHVFNFYIK
jgi:SAM-dependent methyltransferase